MLAFCLAVLLLLATPGPGVLSTAGVGAAFGFRAGLRYVCGLWIGTNLVALIVVSGLAALVLSIGWARNVLLIASSLYLLSIAARIAFAGRRIAFISAASIPGLRAGLLLQLINPKAYAVNLASPHISPASVARASQRRCGGLHGPEDRAGVVDTTFSGPPGVQPATVRFAASECRTTAVGNRRYMRARFSGFVLLPQSLPTETLLKLLIINLLWIPIHLLWLLAGDSVHRLDLSPRAHFAINLAMAAAMPAVVALAIASLLYSSAA